jgi:hypothetical protein
MNYDLHGVAELVTALVIFGIIGILGWCISTKRDELSDNTRMFR